MHAWYFGLGSVVWELEAGNSFFVWGLSPLLPGSWVIPNALFSLSFILHLELQGPT